MYLQGTVVNGVIVIDEEEEKLPDGTRVEIKVQETIAKRKRQRKLSQRFLDCLNWQAP